MNWCILIPLLVGAICALLGYLLGKLLGGSNDLEQYETRIRNLEEELRACEGSKVPTAAPVASASAFVASVPVAAFNTDAAKAAFGKKIKENDLTVVEGIGPKIQELFHNHDIKTWKALSECSVETCQSVLNSGGERFKLHVPKTWPKQAGLAATGKWVELKTMQGKLKRGK